ncbi:hypothetical protein Vretifemale_11156 [Volvox reticuliferus]|uniref:Uncharacterized protein n=2 Tax=Volvox reticuliferus TaxID=1737510 RepID=A0A8J4FS87_9CHLO|nr:hypothetical protein Vretifemale_11156 [Volvox reticuliferus]
MPPAPSKVLPDAKPYLPYTVPEPVVRTLPPEHIAVNRNSPVSSPVRTPTPRRASTGAMGGPCTAVKSRRSTPSASPRTGTPSRQRQGGSSAATPGTSTPPSQHQQHPLFQKAVPLSSGNISSANELKDKDETRGDEADIGSPTTGDIAVSAAGIGGSGTLANGSELNTPREGNINSPSYNNKKGGRNVAAATAAVAASARCAAAAAAAAAGVAASAGSTSGAGRALITDIMVTPSKVLPANHHHHHHHKQQQQQQQRGMRRPASTTAADMLRGSYPIAAWGHDGADVRQSLPGGTTGNNGHNHHHQGKARRSSSVRGSRSVGGALEACSSSPASSPRLRLVPSAW